MYPYSFELSFLTKKIKCMKKLLFAVACFLLSNSIFAQEQTRKFIPSIKVGIGTWLDEPSVFNGELGIQGEYKPADRFSIYGSISFNRMFPIEEISEGLNYFTFLAGPRVYITKSIFAGFGAGYALFVEDGFSDGVFAFNPHIGYDRPKTQWTINYTGLSDEGVIGNLSLGVAFKLGKSKKTLK
jgi:hypothetical protein